MPKFSLLPQFFIHTIRFAETHNKNFACPNAKNNIIAQKHFFFTLCTDILSLITGSLFNYVYGYDDDKMDGINQSPFQILLKALFDDDYEIRQSLSPVAGTVCRPLKSSDFEETQPKRLKSCSLS